MPHWNISDTLSPNAYFQYAAGSYRHPETGLWQLWVIFDSQNVNWVAAFQSEEQLWLVREEIQRLVSIDEKWDRNKAFALLDRLYEQREFEPQPMPVYANAMILYNYVWR